MSDKENISILEQLEQEFENDKTHQLSNTPNNRGRRRKFKEPGKNPLIKELLREKKNRIVCVAMFLVLCVVIVAASRILHNTKNDNGIEKGTPEFLTTEEKKDWKNKKVDENEIFIYVNTSFELQKGNKIQLQLANPPYCAYPLKIKITDREGKVNYYTSKTIKPGQSLESVELKDVPEKKGSYDVVIQYTFYSASGETEVGEHTVNASLVIK